MKNLIAIMALVLLGFTAKSQIVLTTTSHTLELTTSGTSNIDYQVVYFDETASGAGTTSLSTGKITTATTTTILTAPAGSTTRTVVSIILSNTGAAANTVNVQLDVSATEYSITPSYELRSGEALYYDGTNWSRSMPLTSTVTGMTKYFGKTGTASDAAAYHYGYWKDAGILGAWAPGTPGLAGRATDGTTTTDAGCIFFPDAAAGKVRYLTSASITATVVGAFSLYDVLWVNSGLVVTTTTAQTINSVTLPARDNNGTTNGEGCVIGVYATAALGNAAVVSNSTISYTNSAGISGRTATLSATNPLNFPATPVIGTVVWFELQAGDRGVQSIQSITLNTTLTSGSASLFIARKIIDLQANVANLMFTTTLNNGDGVVLYDNACLLPFAQTSATTATNIQGSVTTVER